MRAEKDLFTHNSWLRVLILHFREGLRLVDLASG